MEEINSMVLWAPVIIPPLYNSASVIQVSNVNPNAKIEIFAEEKTGKELIGVWGGEGGLYNAKKNEISISVSLNPRVSLKTGQAVTARQTVTIWNPETSQESEPVVVQDAHLSTCRILEPVARGDTHVWVSGVSPGATIEIHEPVGPEGQGHLLASAIASEPIVKVPVGLITGLPIHAKISLDGETIRTPSIEPITSPVKGGRLYSRQLHKDMALDVADFSNVYCDWGEVRNQAGCRELSPICLDNDRQANPDERYPIMGRLYYPGHPYIPSFLSRAFHPEAKMMPLVIIVHGQYPTSVQSNLGYEYLAKHLVSWGILVFTIDLNPVNNVNTIIPNEDVRNLVVPMFQYTRAEIILKALDKLIEDPWLTGRIDVTRIGLIGHSMGGEAVVIAQTLNAERRHFPKIRGVVNITPTNYSHLHEVCRNDSGFMLKNTKYMQICGSRDWMLQGLPEEYYHNGFHLYDRASCEKTHFWIYGCGHWFFNHLWNQLESENETIARSEHEMIAKGLINAFFQDCLFDDWRYRGYMEGIILPPELESRSQTTTQFQKTFRIYTQHSEGPERVVIDNFGDDDIQGFATGTAPMNKKLNTLGCGNSAISNGNPIKDEDWKNVDHNVLEDGELWLGGGGWLVSNVDNSPHFTRGLELIWKEPNVHYIANTGTGAGVPIATPISIKVGNGINVANALTFSLRIGQYYEDSVHNHIEEPTDLFVILRDSQQRKATLRLGSISKVPYPDVNAPSPLSVMRTYRIPMDAFVAANPALDLTCIQAVELAFQAQSTGHIHVDDLEFIVKEDLEVTVVKTDKP